MIARTSFEQEHRCRLGPPRPAWLRILVLFGVSAAVLCHAQTIAPPDAGGLKVGLYRDGQLIDTLADLAPAPAADLVSSRGIALHSPAVPGGQTLPAAPALSAETQARNAAFARTAQSAVTLRDLLEGLATTAQADTTGPRAELAMRLQDFLDSTADSRAALDRTGQRLAELKLDPVIAARHAQTVAAFEQRLAEFQDRIHDAVYGRPGAVQAALDFLDEARFVDRPSLDKASPTVQVHVLNAPELTREEADALLEGQAGTETGTQSAPETAPSTPPTQTQPAALLPAPVLQPPRPATQAQPGVGKPTRAEAPSANRGASAGRARTSRPVSPSADPATPTTESRSAASTATATSAVPQGVVPRRGRGIELAGGPPPAPDDLLPTIDVQITQAILDKAAALGNSPLAIYEFVRNNVQFQPYLGSRKGSAFTLQQLAGNDTDQASLLLALLRAAGVPCRYVRGSVEMTPEQATSWLGVDDAHTAGSILTTAGLDGLNIVDGGGNVIAIRCTRVWVEAYVPYANYRGVPNDDTGKTWIPLDPAYTGTRITPGEDVLALMGWDADAFLTDYISTFHSPSPIEKLLEDVQAWLDINRPGQTVADIERTIALDELELGLLPASLPYQARSITSRFATLEDAKRYQVRFHLRNGGTTLIDHTVPLLHLVGHRLTIEYVGATPTDQAIIDSYGSIYETPPNLVQVKPLLKLDDVPIATSVNSIGMGRTHNSDMHFLHPTGANNAQPLVSNDIIAGNGQAIAFDSFLDVHDFLLAPPDTTRGNYFEELMYESAVDYLGLVNDGQRQAERLLRIVSVQDVSEAIVENSIKVTTSFGVPVTFEWTGLIVDADRRIVGPFPVDGNDAKTIPYMKLTGYDGSFMEHRIFEDNFESPAVSTIRAFHVSVQQGIPLCTITSSIGAQCPGFSHSPAVTAAVNDALARGNIIIIPRTSITYEQWVGTGYIDMDPTTGAAGYIISGGINGNVTVSGGAIVDWLWPIFPPCLAWPWNIEVKVIDPPADTPDGGAVFSGCDDTKITFKFEVKANCLFSGTQTAIRERTTHKSKKQIADRYGGGDYVLNMSSFFSAPATRRFTIVKPDISVQGLREESLPAPNEENPGAYIVFNGDDDNNNSVPDKDDSGNVAAEDDLEPMTIWPGLGSVNSGSLTLEAVAGGVKVKVWDNADKSGAVPLPKTWPASATIPSTLYVEGYDGSDSERDLALRFRYSGSFTCDDNLKATITQVELDVDCDYDGDIDDADEIIELSAGGVVWVNSDDDNANGTPDKEELFVGGENDLGRINLSLKPPMSAGTLKLEAVSGGGKIKVWENATKGAEVVLPKTWSVGAGPIPTALYVEGREGSTSVRDVELKLTLVSGGKSSEDTIRLTVLSVDIDKIAFNYKPASATDDALNIRDDFTTVISVPEYVKGGQNKPAAYIKDKAVKMLVRLKVKPSSITSLKIKGVSDDTDGSLGNATEKTVTFSGGISQEGTDDASTTGIDESEYVEFTVTGNTPNKVFISEEAWKWIVLEVDGTAVSEMEVERTSGHKVYVLWDTPKSPWNQTSGNAENPWVKALTFAIETASGHDKDDAGALAAITSYLHTGHGLTYHINGGAPAYASSNLGGTMDLTGYIDKSSGSTINCYDQASGVYSFGRLLGIGVEYRYMDPFGYINTVNLVGEGNCNNPFYPLTTSGKIAGADDVYPDRSRFGNHAFTKYGGSIYDACAGPHTGTRTEVQYVSDTVDSSTPAEAAVAGDTTDISAGAVTDLQ